MDHLGTDAHDLYGLATAEFFDLLAAGMWDEFGPLLGELLAGVDPAAGPLVDVGSGTGIGLAHIRAAAPNVAIWAIEPSKAMRTALHARLADRAELRAATTVVPFTLGDAPLPDRACAVLVSAALGHLGPGERVRLWRYVAEQLPLGAPAVVGVLPPDRPERLPAVRYRRLDVGAYAYEGWQSGEPLDDGTGRTMRWTLTYKVLDARRDDAVVTEHTVDATWYCDSVDDVRREIAEFGLALTEHPECVVVRHRAPGS